VAATTPDTPPTITINGDDPAIMRVGDSYADLGATPSRAWHVEPDQLHTRSARQRFGNARFIGHESLEAAHEPFENVTGAAKIKGFRIAGCDVDRAAPDGNAKQRF